MKAEPFRSAYLRRSCDGMNDIFKCPEAKTCDPRAKWAAVASSTQDCSVSPFPPWPKSVGRNRGILACMSATLQRCHAPTRRSRDKQNRRTNAVQTKMPGSSPRRETSPETAKAIGLWPLRAPFAGGSNGNSSTPVYHIWNTWTRFKIARAWAGSDDEANLIR
jgi:hypothetical protein